MNEIFHRSVPKTKRIVTKNYPPWFHSALIKNIKLKFKFWRHFKIHGDEESLEQFKILRKRIKSDTRTAYANYTRNAMDQIREDPKKFWAFVNSKRGNGGLPKVMNFGNREVSQPADIVNAFAEHFSNSFSIPADISKDLSDSAPNPNIINCVNEDQVLKALTKIRSGMTMGPDGVPAFLLKDCRYVLAKPLTVLFNLCIRNSKFPVAWKSSKVFPVYKSGDRSDIVNYRPISLISNFCKVFEILLSDVVYEKVSAQISPFQHGFVKGRSTVTNLFCMTQFIAEAIDASHQTDVLYTDLSKAFDRLDHSILLSKLSKYGFAVSDVALFHSYLSDRTQYVGYGGLKSEEYAVTSGVPQGSVLGPLLFILFFNDIVTELDVGYLMYADDLKIFSVIKSHEDCKRLQLNLDRVNDWCVRNNLHLNTKKCYVLSYSLKTSVIDFGYELDGTLLKRDNTFKDLGITFDTKLSFTAHIENITSDSLKAYGFITRCRHDFFDPSIMKTLYFAFVRSRLEYASLIWCPYYDVHTGSLERVQRKFLKFLAFCYDETYPVRGFPQDLLLERFSLPALEQRRGSFSLVFLYKLLHGRIDCGQIVDKLTFHSPRDASRHKQCFYLSTPRTNILKNSPLYRMCDNYNRCCGEIDVFTCSLKSIKDFYLY